jgi:putative SOS response-associated peptidase YedK
MCQRYSLRSLAAAAEIFAQLTAGDEWIPRFNVALTSRMPVVATRAGQPRLETMQFGIVTPARSPAERPLVLGNARAETMLTKPAFRDAAAHRRCLIPADGFYEWEKQGDTRLPHFFTLKDERPFFFGGIWEPARDDQPAGFSIVTTTPNPLLATIHDRMPVILGPNSGPTWLGDEPLPEARLRQLCRPLPAAMMSARRVDPRVNNVRHDAPDCVAPI